MERSVEITRFERTEADDEAPSAVSGVVEGKLAEAPLFPSTGVTCSPAGRRCCSVNDPWQSLRFQIFVLFPLWSLPVLKLIALGKEQSNDSQTENWWDSSKCLCTTFPSRLPWWNWPLTSTLLRAVHVPFRMSGISANLTDLQCISIAAWSFCVDNLRCPLTLRGVQASCS